jgi:hypothetical protein
MFQTTNQASKHHIKTYEDILYGAFCPQPTYLRTRNHGISKKILRLQGWTHLGVWWVIAHSRIDDEP